VSNAPAWAAVGIALMALLLSIVTTVRTERRERTDKRRRAAAGPSEQVRNALVDARARFTEISNGGQRNDWFMADERKDTGQRLRDLADQVADRDLGLHLTGAATCWDQAFGHAPPGCIRIYGPSGHTDPVWQQQDLDDQRRIGLQEEEAQKGTELCVRALSRLNGLDQP
jgi:hypothetical protein